MARPEPAVCVVAESSLDFGDHLPPSNPGTVEVTSREVTLSNRVITRTVAGNLPLEGEVVLTLGPDRERPPEIVLAEGEPVFSIPPLGSRTFRFAAFVRGETSTGRYEGTISFGPTCATVDFVIDIAARRETAPVFVTTFGRFGTGPGELAFPQGLDVDSGGRVYVVDQGNRRVQVFDANGAFLRSIPGWIESREFVPFQVPRGLAVDEEDRLFVTEVHEEASGADRFVILGPTGEFLGRGGREGQAPSIFLGPEHIATAPGGTVALVDGGHRRGVLGRMGAGNIRFSVENVLANPAGAPFRKPLGIASGNRKFYVTDWSTHCVHVFGGDGAWRFRFGESGASAGQFQHPSGVTVDGEGNVYVVDQGRDRLQKFDANGAFLTEWGIPGTGTRGFQAPVDIAVGRGGRIYVSDSKNHRVHIYDPVPEGGAAGS